MRRVSFNRLTVSKLHNEIMLVYRGRENIYVKKIKFNLKRFYRRAVYVCSVFVLITALVILIPTGKNRAVSNTPDDNEIKNEILLSEETDYSEPDAKKPLTVQIYRVQEGDTLNEIAAKFGVSMDTILGSSNLNSYDYLKIGQVLKVPDRDGMLITVEEGKTLLDIAKKYKVDVDKIMANNQLLNPDFLPVGYDIFIPDAKPQNIIQGWMWPTVSHHITSAFGWRLHPISGKRLFHQGLDIRSKYQWIKASKYGKVTYAGRMGGYGNVVIIAHPNGWKTLYGHLSTIIVKRGQYVKQGQMIAKSGNSGYSAGPHLHFEIIKNGKHLNPRSYLVK
ncbi:MAG: peptidoglycan DD-metalloendopeptidase family protein [Spirochaetota bacterium]